MQRCGVNCDAQDFIALRPGASSAERGVSEGSDAAGAINFRMEVDRNP